MNIRRIWILAAAMGLAACTSAQTGTEGGAGAAPRPEPAQPAPPATADLLPRGSELHVALLDTLSSERSRVGDRFGVTIVDSVTTITGQVVIPRGAVITGLVTGVDDADHSGDEAHIRLNFVRLTLGEANHPFAADVIATGRNAEGSQDPAGVAAGAAADGSLGTVLSGELKSAVEAAGLGPGAGSIIALGSRSEEAILPAGTTFRIRTTVGVQLRR